MRTFQIRVPKNQKIDFCNTLQSNNIDCTIKKGSVVIDGRSLLGVAGLDLSDGATITLTNNGDEKYLMEEWIV